MNHEIADKKVQIVNLTNQLKAIPNAKETLIITLIISIVIGVIGFALNQRILNPVKLVYFGTIMGFVFLGIPAVLTAAFSTLASKPLKKKFIFKRSSYLALAGMLIAGLMYILGIILSMGQPRVFFDLMIFSYLLVFTVRLFTLLLTHPYRIIQSIYIASIHPLIGFLALLMSASVTTTSSALPLPPISPLLMLAKIILGFSILTAGLMILIKVINEPFAKNFGVSTFSLAGAFLAHWIDGSLALEKKLQPLSEKTDAFIGIISFKAKKGIKALFVIPYLHPGPFGEIGGGKMTRAITETVEKKLGATVLVPHGTATHDLNPLNSEDVFRIAKQTAESAKKIKYFKHGTQAIRETEGSSKIIGQRFGNSIMLASTFSPEASEDIDFTIGLAVMKKLSKNYENVFCIDAHNSHKTGHYTLYSGDQRMFELISAMEKTAEKAEKLKEGKIKIGVSVDLMKEYSLQQGIGACGLRAAVIEVNSRKTAYVVIDGNNMKKGLREKILKRIKALKIDEAEVMTTDTHSVNNIQGVENPVGKRMPEKEIEKRALKAVKEAVKDLEEAEVGSEMIVVKGVEVFGAQKATEIVSTVNTMTAMLKTTGPILLVGTITLSLLGVLFIPW